MPLLPLALQFVIASVRDFFAQSRRDRTALAAENMHKPLYRCAVLEQLNQPGILLVGPAIVSVGMLSFDRCKAGGLWLDGLHWRRILRFMGSPSR
jgi:hypothetical protein